MSVFRAFIAIDIPVDVRAKLQQVIDGFKDNMPGAAVRWVPVDNIHLTLKFLGDVSHTNADLLTEIIRVTLEGTELFETSIGNSGAFPSDSRPRVLWVGVTPTPALMNLQKNIDSETARLGYKSDEREFFPHLTLGRVSRSATQRDIQRISKAIKDTKIGFLGAVRVDQVHLYKSDLRPSGAEYTKVYSVGLLPPRTL